MGEPFCIPGVSTERSFVPNRLATKSAEGLGLFLSSFAFKVVARTLAWTIQGTRTWQDIGAHSKLLRNSVEATIEKADPRT
jgi:hypothetical protein